MRAKKVELLKRDNVEIFKLGFTNDNKKSYDDERIVEIEIVTQHVANAILIVISKQFRSEIITKKILYSGFYCIELLD